MVGWGGRVGEWADGKGDIERVLIKRRGNGVCQLKDVYIVRFMRGKYDCKRLHVKGCWEMGKSWVER